MKRSIKNKIFVIVAILIAGVLLVALGNVTGGFQNLHPDDWVLREVNPDNLYHSLTFADTDGVIANGADGITVELGECNELRVTGTAEGAQSINVGTYTLKANTSYVFDSSLTNGTKGTVYMTLVNTAGQEIANAASYNGAVVIAPLATDTVVTVALKIADEFEVNKTLKPILCEGVSASDAVSFYK